MVGPPGALWGGFVVRSSVPSDEDRHLDLTVGDVRDRHLIDVAQKFLDRAADRRSGASEDGVTVIAVRHLRVASRRPGTNFR